MRTATLLALAAILPLAACDDYHDHDNDDDPYVRVIDFEIDTDGYDVSANDFTASYDTDDIRGSESRENVEDALRLAGDGALVLLYVDNRLTLSFDGDSQPYTPLPVTKGYEATTDEGLPYVDYTVTFTYAFDNQDLYFDVISSAALDFDAFYDEIEMPRDLDFRLVTLEADVVFSKQAEVNAKTGDSIDFRNYEQVKAVFGLPD